jgi:hypothetical protein
MRHIAAAHAKNPESDAVRREGETDWRLPSVMPSLHLAKNTT